VNESESRAELIDPQLCASGWGEVEGSLVRRECVTIRKLRSGMY